MKIVTIKPCSAGFGEFEIGEQSECTERQYEDINNDGWEKTEELSGLVHNEPSEIWVLEDDVLGKQYCGIIL